MTAALSVSGFSADRYMFLGFPPRKSVDRKRLFEEFSRVQMPVVLLEAPHRVAETLNAVAEVMPERAVAVCRELTKLHEEVFRGTAQEAAEHFAEPRGEFVVVIGPGEAVGAGVSEEDIAESIEIRRSEGLRGRRLVEQVVADTGEPRSRVYPMVIKAEKSGH